MFVGIDAGGTKTHVLALGERGDTLADFTTRGADISSKSAEEVQGILSSVKEKLLVQAGSPLAGVALGMPGYGEAERWTRDITRVCRETFGDTPYGVFNDVRLALEGAFEGGPGVIVLSGTGSMVWAKDARDREARVGGWGTLFGDEGSAYALGVAALKAVSCALDGRGPETLLTDIILEHLGETSLWSLYAFIDRQPDSQRAVIASLAREVSTAADRGDVVALGLFDRAASELLEHIGAAFEKLELPPATPIAYAGGTFGSSHLREALKRGLVEQGHAPPVEPKASASYGGVLLAQRLPGTSPSRQG